MGSDNIRSSFAVVLVVIIAITAFSFGYQSILVEENNSPKGSDPVEKAPIAEAAANKGLSIKAESYSEFSCPELGFKLDIPGGMKLDKDFMPAFMRISGPDMDIKISREHSPYSGLDGYFNSYMYKYMLDPEYRKANRIVLITNKYRNINGLNTKILAFARSSAMGSNQQQNEYLHAIYTTGEREFYCCFVRCKSLKNQEGTINRIVNSFIKTERTKDAKFNLVLEPKLPVWNAETRAFYDALLDSDSVKWGIFYPNSITKDFSKIEAVEKKLNYSFPITLHYIYLGHRFPMEGMRKAYDRGKAVELTMQVMWNVKPNNTDHKMKNVNFDLIDGMYDDYLREFARDAKAFGHPFIFRLNNEMNSTWVRYSGIALLCDPDVYIRVWRHIYDIFEEEGVKNAIWVFNPNDVDYPPLNWNSQIAYYPGNKYVHMIGLTGYNTGTYYRNKTGEKWRSFTEIYDPLTAKYNRFYSKFPWIITEFGCSSVGGDKEKWIRDMFDNIGRYKNIKAAVWWSYADFDYSRNKKGIPARRYWLDERAEYVRAFRDGLKN